MKDTFLCPEGVCGRADKVLADYYPEFSRSFIRQSIESGKITRLDGSKIEAKSKIRYGDELSVCLERQSFEGLNPYHYDLSILYEDEDILVVDKASGMVVHPGDGTDDKTLVHALLSHCPNNLSPVGAPLRPGIVHRLDKETSGVMVVAKSEVAHLSLVDQFANRKTSKFYQAIICGSMVGMGEFTQPIRRHPTVRVKMAVSDQGKAAHTKWKCLKSYGKKFSVVKCEILTGRTHQIRVHFSASNHPLAGDHTYGYSSSKSESGLFPRVMLHAWRLRIIHPQKRQEMEFSAPLPDDFLKSLERLERGDY